jgi:ankyrin repeat protein
MKFIWGKKEQDYFLSSNTPPLERQNALANAFVFKDWGAFDWMVENGQKPNDVQYEMLWTAVQRQDVDAVKKLIEYGFDVNRIDNIAFREAVRLNNLEIAKLLKDAGADIHCANDEAMSLAAINGNVQMLQLLSSWGVSPDGYEGDPLIRAAESGLYDAVKELIKMGAKVDNGSGNYLPLRAAIKQNNQSMGILLLNKVDNVEEVLADLDESSAFLPEDWKLRVDHWRLSEKMVG